MLVSQGSDIGLNLPIGLVLDIYGINCHGLAQSITQDHFHFIDMHEKFISIQNLHQKASWMRTLLIEKMPKIQDNREFCSKNLYMS